MLHGPIIQINGLFDTAFLLSCPYFWRTKLKIMKLGVTRRIKGKKEELWQYLGDFSNIQRFHPMLKGSHFIEGASSCEVGSTRQCNMKDGNYLKERIVDWKDGSHYTVDIYETSMPMKTAKATLGVTPLGNGNTEAYMNLNVQPKYRILQPLMYFMFKYIAGPTLLRGLEKKYKQDLKLVAG